ncbi:MAG: hypothetical protein GX383_08425 [Clostridium sp.]|jgi:hypothetical protein|nr:hypothetical protein [Clostridium sp.]
MNKLMGFFELKDSDLPAVPWKEFNEKVCFDEKLLWTVRTAVEKGEDLNLPRVVGVEAKEAYESAMRLYNKYKDIGMIVYYPYFIAQKSGTLYVDNSKTVIEAVGEDLWNYVTYNKKEVTVIIGSDNSVCVEGNCEFLNEKEIQELCLYASKVKGLFRESIVKGEGVLLEWSYAYNSDLNKQPVGDRYLVFYEIRTV